MKKLIPYWPLLIIVLIIVIIISIHYYFISPVFSDIKRSTEQARIQKGDSKKEIKEIMTELTGEAVKSIGQAIYEEAKKKDKENPYQPHAFETPTLQLGFLDLSINSYNTLCPANTEGFGFIINIEEADKIDLKDHYIFKLIIMIKSNKFQIDASSVQSSTRFYDGIILKTYTGGVNKSCYTSDQKGILITTKDFSSAPLKHFNIHDSYIFFKAKIKDSADATWYKFCFKIDEYYKSIELSPSPNGETP